MSRERHIDIAVRPGTARADGPAHTARAAGHPGADWVYCPECGMPAWVEWSDAAPSTSGPVEHVKIRCFSRHWFLLPRERLDQ